jgi:hypothetical protein
MHLTDLLNLKRRSRFRLTLELQVAIFGLLAAQVLLAKMPPVDLIVTLLTVLYLFQIGQELKARRDPFTQMQKHVLFGFRAFVFAAVLIGLFVLGLIRRSPIVWITFGLAAVFSLVLLFHGYEQIYKDGESA